MKKLFVLLLIGILLPLSGFTQTLYQGKIIDTNNQPVSGATIVSSKNSKAGTTSDIDGYFKIMLQDTNTVFVSMIGFSSQKVVLNTSKTTIIILKDSLENLDNVVISASREQQKRAEVPASISVVTQQKIDETKAFGIDQIVNQIPGVFLSSSRAASNEQPFYGYQNTYIYKISLFIFRRRITN